MTRWRRLLAAGGVVLAGGAGVVAAGTAVATAVGGGHPASGDRIRRVDAMSSTAPAGCSVRYKVTSRRSGTFTAAVGVKDPTSLVRSSGSWRLTWHYPGGQRVRQVSVGRVSQRGSFVAVTGRYSGHLAGTRWLYLIGSSPSSTAPTGFALNGRQCGAPGTSPSPAPTASPLPTTSSTGSTGPTWTGPSGPTWTGPTGPTSSPTWTGISASPTPTGSWSTATVAPTSSPSWSTSTSSTGSSSSTSSTSPTGTTATSTSTSGGTPTGSGKIQYGVTYSGRATYYDATGEGACMFPVDGDTMIAAMDAPQYDNAAACGDYVQVTGPKGTATLKIVNECPECESGHLDLSPQAFAKIGDPSAGVVPITWTLLSPDLSGPITFRYEDTSTQYWCGVQIGNNRNPVSSVEFLVGGTWTSMPRASYNYFQSTNGSGCGSRMRVTDIFGNQVTTSADVPIEPGVVQQGPAQFPAPD